MERWIDGWLFGWSVGLLAAKPFGDYLFSFHMPPNSSGLTYNYGSLGSPVVSLFFNFFPRSSSAKWINIFTGFLFLFFFRSFIHWNMIVFDGIEGVTTCFSSRWTNYLSFSCSVTVDVVAPSLFCCCCFGENHKIRFFLLRFVELIELFWLWTIFHKTITLHQSVER